MSYPTHNHLAQTYHPTILRGTIPSLMHDFTFSSAFYGDDDDDDKEVVDVDFYDDEESDGEGADDNDSMDELGIVPEDDDNF